MHIKEHTYHMIWKLCKYSLLDVAAVVFEYDAAERTAATVVGAIVPPK